MSYAIFTFSSPWSVRTLLGRSYVFTASKKHFKRVSALLVSVHFSITGSLLKPSIPTHNNEVPSYKFMICVDMPQMVRSLNVVYPPFQASFLSLFYSFLVHTVYTISNPSSTHACTISFYSPLPSELLFPSILTSPSVLHHILLSPLLSRSFLKLPSHFPSNTMSHSHITSPILHNSDKPLLSHCIS